MISDIFHPLYQGKPRRQSWKTWINIAQDDLTKFHNLGFQCRQKIFLDFKSNYLELCFDDSATNFFFRDIQQLRQKACHMVILSH